MKAYIFQAALYCEACGRGICARIDEAGRPAHVNPADESSYDSDEYPKGPYFDGGGEADCPQHCDDCEVFLENPLTTHGVDMLHVALTQPHAQGDLETLATWREFYAAELAEQSCQK